jgi:hypothetical protein
MSHILRNPLPSATLPVAFSVLRVPFFLEPNYAEDKPFIESNRERLIRKWGGREGWERQKRLHDLKGRGREAGIDYFNVSEAIYDLLNKYYFVDGYSLNDLPRLAATVARELKVLLADKAPAGYHILEFLNGDQGRVEIERALSALNKLGINGIPKFIIEGNNLIDGAAHADAFIPIFREIEKRGKVKGGPLFGDILGVSPEIISRGSHWSE